MATTSPGSPARLFTIQEAAEVLRIPISWLYERTRRNAIPCRRLGKYVPSAKTISPRSCRRRPQTLKKRPEEVLWHVSGAPS